MRCGRRYDRHAALLRGGHLQQVRQGLPRDRHYRDIPRNPMMDQFSTLHKLMFNPVEGEGRPVTAADVAAVLSPGEIPVHQGDGRRRMVSTLDRNESMVIVIYTGGTIGMKATRRDDCDGACITSDALQLCKFQWPPTRP